MHARVAAQHFYLPKVTLSGYSVRCKARRLAYSIRVLKSLNGRDYPMIHDLGDVRRPDAPDALLSLFESAMKAHPQNTAAFKLMEPVLARHEALPSQVLAVECVRRIKQIADEVHQQMERPTASSAVKRETVKPRRARKPEVQRLPTHAELERLRADGLFMERYYRLHARVTPEEDAWLHFLESGGSGADPHPLFNTNHARVIGAVAADRTVAQLYAVDSAAASAAAHPLFDPAHYASTNGIALKPGESALAHYVSQGRHEGLSTHPLIDLNWIDATFPPRDSRFDLVEYIANPSFFGLSPTPLFNNAYYLAQNGDVAEAGVNAFIHYILHGHAQNRKPNKWFGDAWYHARNRTASRGLAGLVDYAERVQRQSPQPHPLFDPAFYLQIYQDVAVAGVDPYQHFVAYGAAEGRTPGFIAHALIDLGGDLIDRALLSEALLGLVNPFDVIQPERLLAKVHEERRESRRLALWKASRPLRVIRKRLRSIGIGGKRQQSLQQFSRVIAKADDSVSAYLVKKNIFDTWQDNNRFTDVARLDLERRLAVSGQYIKFSIVTPVYKTPPQHLREMVASVVGQIYENWELHLIDDASPDNTTWPLLKELAAQDQRIRIHKQALNGGISSASNAGLALANGDFIALLDHDDLLTPDALAEVALYLSENPDTDVVYSDDDKIDDSGHRFAPQFKPDWSPVLLLSYMYLSHLSVFRRSLLAQVEGFRSEFDGAQDYDFFLRATEKARAVGHIPRILYHWRAAAGSTATSGDAKPESFERGQKAVQEALDRRGIVASAYRPDWAKRAKVGMFSIGFPDTGPSVTIVIPTYNQVELLRDCVESLPMTTYQNFDVLIVDNGSDDPEARAYLNELNKRSGHRVLRIPQFSTGFSFARLLNEAVPAAEGKYVLLLNNDTKVINPEWLSQMVGYAQMKGVGSVGAKLYFGDHTIQHAGIVKGYNDGLVGHAFRNAAGHDWGYMGFARTSREYSAVTAACVLTPKDLFLSMGGYDEENFAVAYNDVDYGFRLVDRGYTNIYCSDAELFHFEGKTRPKRDNPREVAALRTIYGDWHERWYNPNLTLEHEDFSLCSRRTARLEEQTIRVAFICHSLNREGAPNTLLDLIIGLKRSGLVDPVVFSPGEGALKAAYAEAGIQVFKLELPSPKAEVRDYKSALRNIADSLLAANVSVVVANTLTMYHSINAASLAGIASIWCQHESEPWDTYYSALSEAQRAFAYAAFGQAYRVTYVAESTRRGWDPVRTRHNAQVIRHGIREDRMEQEIGRWTMAAARKKLGVRAKELVIVVAGTVCERKGQLDLVQAVSRLPDSLLSKVRIFIAGAPGEPQYVAEVERAIAQLAPIVAERLKLEGAVDDMTLYFAAADIYVCTSRVESAPRVLVEAMAHSLPIVTTDVFGIPEMVDENVNALFYKPADIDALARHLTSFLENKAMRTAFGSASPYVLRSRPGYAEMVQGYAEIIAEAAMLSAVSVPAEA